MKKKTTTQILIGVLFLFIILLITDVFVHLRYQSEKVLQFDSNEFNNILTPIISFLGFLCIIITIIVALNQLYFNNSETYYKGISEVIFEIFNRAPKENFYPNIQVFDFLMTIRSRVDEVLKDEQYKYDLQNFLSGKAVSSKGRQYDDILGELRFFKIQALMLYKETLNLIKEIETHPKLTEIHKDLLLQKLIGGPCSEYLACCKLLIEHPEINWIENCYQGFLPEFQNDDKIRLFDNHFFELYYFITNSYLVKYRK
jgi:hypothetical protein